MSLALTGSKPTTSKFQQQVTALKPGPGNTNPSYWAPRRSIPSPDETCDGPARSLCRKVQRPGRSASIPPEDECSDTRAQSDLAQRALSPTRPLRRKDRRSSGLASAPLTGSVRTVGPAYRLAVQRHCLANELPGQYLRGTPPGRALLHSQVLQQAQLGHNNTHR